MDTKEKILNATLELAAEQGLGSVSLAQIAERVGIQKPSLYNHFSSKEDIVSSLYDYLYKKAEAHQNEWKIDYGEMVKGKDLYTVLNEYAHAYSRFLDQPDVRQFHVFIQSEHSIHKKAAQIAVTETEQMILSCKQLFYAIEAHHIAKFLDVDAAALSYAMGVRSIINFNDDQKLAGTSYKNEKMLNDFIQNFAKLYK